MKLETLAVHAGQAPDPSTGAIAAPIVLSSTYAQQAPEVHKGYEYARSGNPTRAAVEACLAALEGGHHGLMFSSGLAAASSVGHLLRPGEAILCSADVYLGTLSLFTQTLQPLTIGVQFTDFTDPAAVDAACNESVKLIWIDSPSNPTLRVYDLAALGEIARRRGIPLVVDSTLATPVLQRPLSLGATMVCHSVSKYLNGHSDVTAGCLVTSDDELAERLHGYQDVLGGVPSPFDCYLTLRGLKTLPLRMERSCANAAALASWLTAHPLVARVIYPGLESHPDHALARRQMALPGAMVTFVLRPGPDGSATERVRRLLSSTRLFACAHSLGGVESLLESPALMTHRDLPLEFSEAMGVEEGMVRMSVGVEHLDDLRADLAQALETSGRSG